MFMENQDNVLRNNEKRQFTLEGGGSLSLEYHRGETIPILENPIDVVPPLEHRVFDDLEDLARKKILHRFVSQHLLKYGIEWNRICVGKLPYEQAQAVFDACHLELKQLDREIKMFKKLRIRGGYE